MKTEAPPPRRHRYIRKQQYRYIFLLSERHIPHFILIRNLTYYNCELLQSISNSIVKTADFYFDLVNNHQILLKGIPNCVKIIHIKYRQSALEIVENFRKLSPKLYHLTAIFQQRRRLMLKCLKCPYKLGLIKCVTNP